MHHPQTLYVECMCVYVCQARVLWVNVYVPLSVFVALFVFVCVDQRLCVPMSAYVALSVSVSM